jgi:hypothetical protein
MATEATMSHSDLLIALEAADWSVVLQAIAIAETRIRGSVAGDSKVEEIVMKLVAIASHPKWELRRAVANAAAQAPHRPDAYVPSTNICTPAAPKYSLTESERYRRFAST